MSYVIELADTTQRLFENMRDPHLTDIALTHFRRKTLPPELLRGIQLRLPDIRKELESRSVQCCPLNACYYDNYREAGAETDMEARRCVAGIGHASKAVGLWHHIGSSDLIWEAYLQHGILCGAGRAKHTLERCGESVGNDTMSISDGRALLALARERLRPTNIKRLEQK